MTKLTIAIANFNGQKTLERCINSCKSVKLQPENFEILIVDNDSNDNSCEIVKNLQNHIENIRLEVNSHNIGRIKNWNRCLNLARGEYMIFLSVNDYLHEKNNIHELIKILDDDDSISTIVSYFVLTHGNNESMKRVYFDSLVKCKSHEFISFCVERGLLPFPTQSLIFRTGDVIKEKNFFPENMQISGDQVFTCYQACLRKHMLFNPIPLAYWVADGERFHFGMKFAAVLAESAMATELISKKINVKVNDSYFVTYTLGRFLFEAKNLKNIKDLMSFIFSYMLKKKVFFSIDNYMWYVLKEKIIHHNKKNFFDILYSKLVTSTKNEQ